MKTSWSSRRGWLCQGGVLGLVLVLGNVVPGFGQAVYQRVRAFGFIERSSALPVGALVQGTNGALFGMSQGGGQAGKGTVFTLRKDGSGFTVIRSFSGTNGDGATPWAGLLLATNGVLYGMTSIGGYRNLGTIFRVDQDGDNYAVVQSFTGIAGDGASPYGTLMQAGNGLLYGTTGAGGDHNLGAIFSINPDGTGYSVIKSFSGGTDDGANPIGTLIQGTNGMLFGTTVRGGASNLGTIFMVNLGGSVYQLLKSFTGAAGDGAQPEAALVQAGDGTLWGTTFYGGAYTNQHGDGQGTVFRLNQDGSGYQVIKGFTGTDGANPIAALIQGTNGILYGTTSAGGSYYDHGTVFQINPDGSGFQVINNYLANGSDPWSALVQANDGVLYGMTRSGGLGSEGGEGTAFKVNLNGSGYTVIWMFSSASADGFGPQAPLVEATNGCLYGTTQNGGLYGQGTVFKINRDGTGYVVLRSFTGTNFSPALPDGSMPVGGLLQATDGALYGTTTVDYQVQIGNHGLDFGNGTVFKLNLDGSGYQVIKRFAGGTAGSNPYGTLVQATNGLLYGTTMSGGAAGVGIVFKLNLNGASLSVIYNFSGANGYECPSGLLQGSDGELYGETVSGGTGGRGTVFKMRLNGTSFQVLQHFFGTNGAMGWSPLIQGLDGAFYGTTFLGGSANAGTVFKVNGDGSRFTVLRSFTGSNGDGKNPRAALVQASNGILYGTTSSGGGSNAFGTVFKLNPDGTGYAQLRSCIQNGYDGILPTAGLIETSDGTLYGTASAGGTDQNGTIYSIVPPAILLPATLDAGALHLSFLALPGRSYTVQRAPAPSGPWTPLGTVPVGTNGVGTFEDLEPPTDGAFYRTTSP